MRTWEQIAPHNMTFAFDSLLEQDMTITLAWWIDWQRRQFEQNSAKWQD